MPVIIKHQSPISFSNIRFELNHIFLRAIFYHKSQPLLFPKKYLRMFSIALKSSVKYSWHVHFYWDISIIYGSWIYLSDSHFLTIDSRNSQCVLDLKNHLCFWKLSRTKSFRFINILTNKVHSNLWKL